MMSVSGVNINAAQPVTGAERAQAAPQAEKPEEKARSRSPRPMMDEYVPEEKGDKEERCVCDTGRVDREIEQLKMRRQELEQRLAAETDEAKARELERQLAQTQRELGEKDNDTYRKRHSAFTRLS